MNKHRHRIFNNDNLISVCLSYLSPKDLSNTSQTSRKLNRLSSKFNAYWKKECENYFCSEYESQR